MHASTFYTARRGGQGLAARQRRIGRRPPLWATPAPAAKANNEQSAKKGHMEPENGSEQPSNQPDVAGMMRFHFSFLLRMELKETLNPNP